jgi:DNA processing protein
MTSAALRRQAEDFGARIIEPGDAEWPTGLDDLEMPPKRLWIKGPVSLTDACNRSVAVIGARAATSYGIWMTSELSHGLAQRDVTIVSDAALGVGAAAHHGALTAGGTTVAVLACGIDVAYPSANAGLLKLIEANGAIVSEYPPGTMPRRHRCIDRTTRAIGECLGVSRWGFSVERPGDQLRCA